MAKNKSISDLVTDLQTENESLQFLKKLFDRAVAQEFGRSTKEVHQIIAIHNAQDQQKKTSDLSHVSPEGNSTDRDEGEQKGDTQAHL